MIWSRCSNSWRRRKVRSGPKHWSNLPPKISGCPNSRTFKKNSKQKVLLRGFLHVIVDFTQKNCAQKVYSKNCVLKSHIPKAGVWPCSRKAPIVLKGNLVGFFPLGTTFTWSLELQKSKPILSLYNDSNVQGVSHLKVWKFCGRLLSSHTMTPKTIQHLTLSVCPFW